MKKRIIALILALIMVGLVIFPLISTNLIVENRTFFALDTVINITAYGSGSEQALSEINKRLTQIDRDFSAYNESSYVYKINENAGIEPVAVSDEVFNVIETALYVSEITDGAFDITVKPLVDLWQVSSGGYVPTDEEISATLKAVGYKNVVLDFDKKTVFLTKFDTKIDLGGIAKGYAGDEVRRILAENGVKSAVADLGGNVILHGKKPSLFGFKSDFRVGIRTPFAKSGEYCAVVKESDTSLVTSGAYERYFEKDGTLYHHIIDPRTGKPSESDLKSATVICENSALADALSTAVFVMGSEKATAVINSIADCKTFCIGVSGKIFASDEKILPDLEVVDKNYVLE